MQNRYSSYLTLCHHCGGTTNRRYAREHQDKCKSCVEGTIFGINQADRRNARIIDHGWSTYAREEGHYDLPDNY